MIFKYEKFLYESRLYNIVKYSRSADYYVNGSVGTGHRFLSITVSKHLYKYYDY